MGLVFVDRECPICGGQGCDHCEGSGIHGECVERPDIRLPEPSRWARELRAWRLAAKLTLMELSVLTGLGVVVLSELENGLRDATDAEKKVLDACREEWR